MINENIEQLNNMFSFDCEGVKLKFKLGKGKIPVVEIKNKQASAVVSLQGGHLLSWQPHDDDDVIWLSTEAVFEEGKSIRGGIPVCWPWFGAHEHNDSFPAHGFARTVIWDVIETQNISSDETRITFRLSTNQLNEKLKNMWPQDTVVEYRLTVSKKLILELVTFNHSEENITIGQALHTYFNVGDISKATVYGLEGKTYLDKPDNFKAKIQSGAIRVNSEVDRVYLDTPNPIIIDSMKRKIVILKEGSSSTVVWNPWEEVANKMGDLGENGYQQMLCVESANAADDVVTISPASSYTLKVIYEVNHKG